MAAEIQAPEGELPSRAVAAYSTIPTLTAPFIIDAAHRSYKHQYSNIYFVRLVELRPIVEERATEKWKDVRGRKFGRPANSKRGQLCYIVGTVYMDMEFKPNVLDDIGRSHWVAAPAARPKFYSSQDSVHLEDESGRVRLVGEVMRKERERDGGGFVTGVIVAALGMETGSGDFEVLDLCFAGMPELYKVPEGKGKGKQKEETMDVDETLKPEDKTWVAMVSGLSIGGETAELDLKAQLLVEWLSGEDGGMEDQLQGARIARLVVAGNALAPVKDDKKHKRFNHDSKEPLNSNHPTKTLSILLSDLLASSLPVNLVPGADDPAGAILPQQPMPKVMFGGKKMKGLECMSNPAWLEVGDRSILCSGGQTLDDVFKYLPGRKRVPMAERTLEWRHIAPTAPDTLWIYPFPDTDPFVLRSRPNVYCIGNQPDFETKLVGSPGDQTRIVLLPSFATTGTVALVCLETLEVRTITFEVPAWPDA